MSTEGGQNSSLETDSFRGSVRMLGPVVASVVKKLLCTGGWGFSVMAMASFEVGNTNASARGWNSALLAVVSLNLVSGESDALVGTTTPSVGIAVAVALIDSSKLRE